MSKLHSFNFWGGEKLNVMGATWFVSYAYYTYIDKSHVAWCNVKTSQSRASVFRNSVDYHKFWLLQVLMMDNDNLNTNTLHLDAKTTKSMAQTILEKRYKILTEK